MAPIRRDDRVELGRCDLSRPVLRLRLPCAPSQNVWKDLHWARKAALRSGALDLALAQVGVLSSPWSRHALLAVVRCSAATVRADSANVWGGVKELVDVLLAPRPKRPGVGLLVDDDPQHLMLGGVEDRARGHWVDLEGPATWVYLIALDAPSLTCPRDQVVELAARYVAEVVRAELARSGLVVALNAAATGGQHV